MSQLSSHEASTIGNLSFMLITPYKALIFDLGKVVFDLSFRRVFQVWAKASNRQADELEALFRFDELFDQFEKAAVTPPHFRAELSSRLGLTLTDAEFDAGWCDLYLATYPGINALLAQLKRQYQLVALTNTNSIHSPVWHQKYADTLRYFDRVFSSHELQVRKPEAPAYHRVLDYLQVRPAEVVFLDDNPDNIKGAAQLGIKTILVTSYDQMTAALQSLGLLH
ncbi:MAG: HAD family phosphatase [Hymenobacter sp.]|nr:MAG: HAD family phosphatase [Hymenobacter sp.]